MVDRVDIVRELLLISVVKLETFMHFELIDRSPHTESNVGDQNKRSLINWNVQIDR